MHENASVVQILFDLFHPSFLLFFLSFWVADSEGQCLIEIPSSSWVSAVNLSYAFSMKSPMNRWYLMTLLNHDFMHMFYLMYSWLSPTDTKQSTASFPSMWAQSNSCSSWVSAVNLSPTFLMKSPMNRWYLVTLLDHDYTCRSSLVYSLSDWMLNVYWGCNFLSSQWIYLYYSLWKVEQWRYKNF